jgi:competence protein ComEC
VTRHSSGGEACRAALRALLAWVLLALGPAGCGAEGAPAADAPPQAEAPSQSPPAVRITFLDVGQGDAVLVRAPEGETALVDAGERAPLAALRELGVERIDLLVATHPHADHIGGMVEVLAALPVRYFMDNGEPHTTATYRELIRTLENRSDITYLAAEPRTVELGSVALEVLPLLPVGLVDHNDRSVALVVRFGAFRAFLSGDSEVRQLTHLVGLGAVPDVTLLKAAHHGSHNGVTRSFLAAARPEVVVISVGRNGYGHPHAEALGAYAAAGAEIYRTDAHGQVTVLGHRDGGFEVVTGAGGRASPESDPWRGTRGSDALELWVFADAPGNDNQNRNGEYAVIESRARSDLDVSGWTLCDAAGACFRFPPGTVLAAGGHLVVFTGSGTSDGVQFFMGFGRAVWNNDGDTATLYDATGQVVLVSSYE